jgi:hypothetical protein
VDQNISKVVYEIYVLYLVILKFMRQFNFAKCKKKKKIKCQETSKGTRFSVACIPKKRIIDDFSKRQIDFFLFYDYSYFSYNFHVKDVKIQIMRTLYEIII